MILVEQMGTLLLFCSRYDVLFLFVCSRLHAARKGSASCMYHSFETSFRIAFPSLIRDPGAMKNRTVFQSTKKLLLLSMTPVRVVNNGRSY